jgi:hypothetical protein
MKKLVVLLLTLLVATSAFAGIDPDADMMGFYFDATGDNNCAAVVNNVPTPVYVLYTGATVPFIEAYTFDYDVTVAPGFSSLFFRLGEALPPGAIRVGENDPTDATKGGPFAVGLAEPLDCTSGAATLVAFTFMILSPGMEAAFNLMPNPIPSLPGNTLYPEVQGPGGGSGLMTVGFSTENGVRSAVMNGDCPVAEEVDTWGSVKSLYR